VEQLLSPILNMTSLVHVRAITYVLSQVLWQNDICSFRYMTSTLQSILN